MQVNCEVSYDGRNIWFINDWVKILSTDTVSLILDGKKYTFNDNELKFTDFIGQEASMETSELMVFFEKANLSSLDEPSLVINGSIKYWFIDNKFHRDDGPALENNKSGSKSWFIENELHRDDGPALIVPDEEPLYYLHGKRITDGLILKLIQAKEKINKGITW